MEAFVTVTISSSTFHFPLPPYYCLHKRSLTLFRWPDLCSIWVFILKVSIPRKIRSHFNLRGRNERKPISHLVALRKGQLYFLSVTLREFFDDGGGLQRFSNIWPIQTRPRGERRNEGFTFTFQRPENGGLRKAPNSHTLFVWFDVSRYLPVDSK